MCGIIAVVGNVREGDWGQTHRLLSALFVESMERGTDASGFAAVTSSLDRPSRHRLITAKEPLPADAFTRSNPFWQTLRRMRCCSVLGHVRWTTSGTALDNRNNHPFTGGVGRCRFSVVHNGIFSDPQETAHRLAVKLTTRCDSEIAEKLITITGDTALGLRRCLSELRGSMALAAVDHSTGTIWLARDHNRPLWIARLKDRRRIVVASTAEIIVRAIRKTMGSIGDEVDSIQPIAANYVHAITPDGRILTPFFAPARSAAQGGQ